MSTGNDPAGSRFRLGLPYQQESASDRTESARPLNQQRSYAEFVVREGFHDRKTVTPDHMTASPDHMMVFPAHMTVFPDHMTVFLDRMTVFHDHITTVSYHKRVFPDRTSQAQD